MDYEYVVEARDFIKDLTIVHETFEDSNTAYHLYRSLTDQYAGDENIVITLQEPK